MLSLHDPLLIISDLDGTLLDHHNYSWEPARSWLETLRRQGIPLILCSSKTSAEIRELQQELDLSGLPFIAENGGLISLDVRWNDSPHYPHYIPDITATAIDVILEEIRQQLGFRFTTFSDVTAETISEWTGLAPDRAELAQQREASQTLIWRDDEEQFSKFRQLLAHQGLALIEGGRFFHVQGERATKGKALHWLTTHYQQREDHARITVGLGDGPNDISMLEATDYAVIVKGYNRHGVSLSYQAPQRVYRTTQYGPEGWSEGLSYLIQR
ncbi:mannosyl-3-phosphoglycerate phosphatase [Salmonella enterica subsp. enterica serovar Choleraesuis]|nr:mannosyl-3-phosphoglycerate phosphatase [Salmonella enterica subsp. enterica serovar Choleraesuis]